MSYATSQENEKRFFEAITCILPISSANKTSPDMQIDIANMISPTNLLVWRFCPNALQQQQKLVRMMTSLNCERVSDTPRN